MGAPVRSDTEIGRLATPIRRRLNRMIKRIEHTPPSNVKPYGQPGYGQISPRGWLGARLYEYAKNVNDKYENPWHDEYAASAFVRAVWNGRGHRRRQLELLDEFLHWIDPIVSQCEVEATLARRERIEYAATFGNRGPVSLGLGEDEIGQVAGAAVEASEPPVEPMADALHLTRAEPSAAVSEPPDRMRVVHVQPARTGDPEIDAIADGVRILTPLDDVTRQRVMNYLATRFEVVV